MKMELPKDKPFGCKVDKNKPRIRRAALQNGRRREAAMDRLRFAVSTR